MTADRLRFLTEMAKLYRDLRRLDVWDRHSRVWVNILREGLIILAGAAISRETIFTPNDCAETVRILGDADKARSLCSTASSLNVNPVGLARMAMRKR